MSEFASTERLVRAHFRHTTSYKHVQSIEALSSEAGLPPESIIKLDGNENPYGCAPSVNQALFEHEFYHIYPDNEQRQLRQALEKYTGVPARRILAGCGSDEMIDLVVKLLLDPGDIVINFVPTFSMYSYAAENSAGRVLDMHRDENFVIDTARAVEAAIDQKAKLIFLASPNNPTGNITPREDIMRLLKTGTIVVLDEAYYEFSGETALDLVNAFDNLIILRTFSKWAGLAGLRIGYGIFPDVLMPYLWRIKTPYTVNKAAQIAAIISLQERAYYQKTIKALIQERDRMLELLSSIPNFTPYPSRANFVLCRVAGGRAKSIHDALISNGISLRYFDSPKLHDYLRISAGKPEHTDALIAALRRIC